MKELIFGYTGVCYQETPLAVRELVSFTDSKKMELWKELQKIGVEQCMILSTCNRSEIFFFSSIEKTEEDDISTLKEKESVMEQVRQCYENVFPEVEIQEYLRWLQGEMALAYLFRVTAGLESLVLGEDQILGQVGDAMDFARTMGHGGKELNKVVRDAITCGKEVKTTFKISEKPLSVSYVGIQCLEKTCGITDKKVLVLGSGKTATLALTYLVEYGAAEIFVSSRTYHHARKLRESFPQIQLVEYDARYEKMRDCDIVVTATASPHLVVRQEEFSKRIPKEKKIIFLDLATPRDVDRKLENRDGVSIIDLDTLQHISEANQKERERLAKQSEGFIREAVTETFEWLKVSRMDDTIESLQKRCQDIVGDSYDYLNRKLDLSHREQKIVKKVLNASLQRLLREPIQELKQLDTREEQEKYREMVQHLFQIEE